MRDKVLLTSTQRTQLEDLWFKYGNNGPLSTMSNHKFIQRFLEGGEDLRTFYNPDKKLIELVDAILVGKQTF